MRFKKYYIESVKEDQELITEGGGFGHISNIYEMKSWTFKMLKEFINDSLTGNLTNVCEKTDGLNLLVTYKDGEIRAARNKGNIKESGKTSMTTNEVSDKFHGRGAVGMAFAHAMIDMGNAFKSISEEQLHETFLEGKRFISLEVIFEEATNVIPYGFNELTMQQLCEYDNHGNIIKYTHSNKLFDILSEADAIDQSTFNIGKLRSVDMPIVEGYDERLNTYLHHINMLMEKTEMTDDDTLETFYKVKTSEMIPLHEIVGLMSNVGNTVIANMPKVMARNPNQVVEKLIVKVNDTVNKIRASGDTELVEKMNNQMQKLLRAGGVKQVQPSEGITFMYEGKLLKLTGTYSSVNQILGLVPYTY